MIALAIALVFGCQKELQTDTGRIEDSATGPLDLDGDGWSEDDCDDTDASIHPEAEEILDGKDNDCDGEIDEGLDPDDLDGDGWTTDEGDCDDTDADVNPGATDDCENGLDLNCDDALGSDEVCDGVDNDCDGDIDEPSALDAETWYADSDADGWGGDATVAACDQPDGYTSDGGDCDDGDALVNPGADEICNGVDDDCDGFIDDEDPEGVADTWYTDSDGDGYGDSSDPGVQTCDPPSGAVLDNGDCDDSDGGVNPGALELCDGADQDCDGAIDEDASDASTWYSDADTDGYGDAAASISACDQPSGYVSDDSDCDDTDGAVNPNEDEICDSIDNDCDGDIDEDDATDASTWYADADTDGYGDATASTSACDEPSGYVSDDTDCDDTDSAVNPGEDEICDGIDNDCDGDIDEDDATDASTWYADADTDGYGDATASTSACDEPSGYVSDDTDCDDADSAVNPGEDEICDGIDNDCDGDIDEDDATDASTWYADTDTDGYGDATASTSACDQPSGYVSDHTDCDDTDSAVNPGEDEICDGIDNDCDGDIDEDDATDASTWYADADTDGYGDATTSTSACDQPSGYVSDDTDCDDTDASLNPDTVWYADADTDGYGDASTTQTQCEQPSGYVADNTDCDDTDSGVNPAAAEVCDALDTDEDCDGSADDADAGGASGKTTWYPDGDGDGYGDEADPGTDYCDEPSGVVTDNTDCDDTDANVNPGVSEVVLNGIDDNCDGIQDDMVASDEAGWTIVGTSSSHAIGDLGGALMSSDLDGDGDAELIIAGPYDDTKASDAGAIAFHDTGTSGAAVDFDAGTLLVTGAGAGDRFGAAVVLLGDLDGDGDGELGAGAFQNDDGGTNAGMMYFFEVDGLTGTEGISSIRDGWIRRYEDDAEFGYSAAAGDLDGDGDTDLVVGAPGDKDAAGRAYVYWGADGYGATTQSAKDSEFYVEGLEDDDNLGTSVHISGDLDADGYGELVVCGSGESTNGSGAGACYLIEGGTGLSGDDDVTDFSSAEFRGSTSSDQLGYGQLSTTSGDLDDDGTGDLILGVPGFDGGATNGGAAWIYFGGSGFSGTYSDVDADILAQGDGALGRALEVSDVNGDGAEDLLAGAPTAGASTEGVLYLLDGGMAAGTLTLPDDQYASWTGDASGDELGAVIGSLEDLDGDGTEDLGIGAPGNDDAASGAGILYVVDTY